MGRLTLHRSEYDRWGMRLLAMVTLVMMFGLFSASVIWLVGEEAGSRTFEPVWQTQGWEWDAKQFTEDLPVAVALLIVPSVAGLAIGVHSVAHGGILAFLVGLFNLLPLYVNSAANGLSELRASPTIWAAFVVGMLLAFYVGDIGSWLCRRRLIEEAMEDGLEDFLEDPLHAPAHR